MNYTKAIILCAATAAFCASAQVSPQPDSQVNSKTQEVLRREFSMSLPVLTVQKRLSGKMVGHCSSLPLAVSVGGGEAPLRISFSDDTPNGSGETIRNSLWTAALVAALQKESALQGVRISLDFKGGMDGPSAGAVMCLGIMSSLDGRDFPDDFAMTGTILPDGTVGLVGGVPEKLKAAAKNPKIKRVAIPAFLRFARDTEGKWVDLFELGRELGLELRPVESIGDAYRFLHKEKPLPMTTPSALAVCREAPSFERAAAEEFKKRDAALRTRLEGLSSNDFDTVSNGFEWQYVNPVNAEQRFEEGAIFDALNLVARADAALTATLDSWQFYREYRDAFIEEADKGRRKFEKSLSGTDMHMWPIERQLAFVDGFRAKMSDFCERVLGWKDDEEDEDDDENAEKDEPWKGFIPAEGTSDLETQLNSLVEGNKAEGWYRYMEKQTFDRSDLKKAILEGERSIYQEIGYDRKKLFFLMSAKIRVGSFKDVALPVLNAGPEAASALELFRKAWMIADKMIETEVVDSWASNASVHQSEVREYLIGKDEYYAVYSAATVWGRLCLALYDETISDGTVFECPSYTASTLMFCCADLFAEASAQLLALEGETDNASFIAFITQRARSSALRGMEACRNAGIPCFGAVLSFQKAERGRADRSSSTTQVLADYWKATMMSKALLMAFKNGKGVKDGFSGYPARPEVAAAKEAGKAMFQALFNADFGPLLKSLPDTWIKAVSDSAAVVAEKSTDDVWNALRDVIAQAGRLCFMKSEQLADELAEAGDASIGKDDIRASIENWGSRLLGISMAASRETVSKGGLASVLLSPERKLTGSKWTKREIALPTIEAKMESTDSVQVTAPELSDSPDLFKKVEGKMVYSELISLFEDCATWKAEVEKAFADTGSEEENELLPILKAISETLQKAANSKDEAALKTLVSEITSLNLLSDGDDN